MKLQRLAVYTEQRSLDPKTERGTLGTGMYLTDTMTTPHVRTCSGDISKHKAMISYCAKINYTILRRSIDRPKITE